MFYWSTKQVSHTWPKLVVRPSIQNWGGYLVLLVPYVLIPLLYQCFRNIFFTKKRRCGYTNSKEFLTYRNPLYTFTYVFPSPICFFYVVCYLKRDFFVWFFLFEDFIIIISRIYYDNVNNVFTIYLLDTVLEHPPKAGDAVEPEKW